MATRKGKIEAALLAKGFQRRDGDHRYFVYYGENGTKSTVKTKTSHGAKGRTITKDLFSRMARQVHLTNGEFRDLIDCPMSRIEYESILSKKGKI